MTPSSLFAGRAQAIACGWPAVLFAAAALAGCQSVSSGLWKSPSRTAQLARRADSPTDVAGPAERKLRAARWDREKRQDPGLAAALEKYDAAERLYQSGHYSDAERAFKHLAKERRRTYESTGARWDRLWGLKDKKNTDPYSHYGDPVEEDSMFMVAESQFAQKKYSWAQDSYTSLLEQYPSTRHMEDSTSQLFRIAMYWLGVAKDPAAQKQVALAGNASIDPAHPPKAPQIPPVPVVPNFTDRTRPVFDTAGRALQALRSIWLHDAAGPLADDALMLSANHHLRTGDFVEATRLYKLLREQYPDSPHYQDAHLLGAYVTMASYEGASYDGVPLTEAKQLKSMALQMFPDISPEERERLEREIVRMDNEEISRLWNKVEYYQVKRQPRSIAVYCNLIIHKYPDSKYAERARQLLVELEPRAKPPAQNRTQPAKAARPETAPGDESPDGDNEEDVDKPRPFVAPTDPAELTGKIDFDTP